MTPKRRLLLWLTVLLATAAAALLPEDWVPREPVVEAAATPGEKPPREAAQELEAPRDSVPAAPSPRLAAAPDIDLFAAKTWYVAPPFPPPLPAVTPPPPPPPTAPPLPFQYLGSLDDGAAVRAFLVRGDRAYVVAAGQVIDGSYRVGSIRAGQITLTYLPLGIEQVLSIGSTL